MSSKDFPKAPCAILPWKQPFLHVPRICQKTKTSPCPIYRRHICHHCSDTTPFWIKASDALRCPGLYRSKSKRYIKPEKTLAFQPKALLFTLLPFGLSKIKALTSSQYFFLFSYSKKKTVICHSAATLQYNPAQHTQGSF